MSLEPNNPLKFYTYLRPLSWLYGLVVGIRNFLYKWGLLRSESFPIPVICVGNITVGGTGKTPHVEYILRHFSDQYHIAVISRGYKRKSQGFHLVEVNSSGLEMGDEAVQVKKKFPHVVVAVDANRKRGIKRLMKMNPKPDFILMDDGFQHRHVVPSFNILLTSFRRPFFQDRLLPEGQLREQPSAQNRADVIVLTKCPADLRPIDLALLRFEFDLIAQQQLFFSKIKYGTLQLVFGNSLGQFPKERGGKSLLITGIANAEPLKEYLSKFFDTVEHLQFPDHHAFASQDLKMMVDAFSKEEYHTVITTEKDAVRLRSFEQAFPKEFKDNLYFLPIELTFFEDGGAGFIDLIEKHLKSFTN